MLENPMENAEELGLTVFGSATKNEVAHASAPLQKLGGRMR